MASNRKYTVLLMSEDGEETKRFRISRRGYRFTVIAAILIVAAGISTVFFFTPRVIDYEKMKSQHTTLMNERLKLAAMLKDLKRIREMDSYIRQSLGMDLEVALQREAVDTFESELGPGVGKNIPLSFRENIPSYMPVEGFISQDYFKSPLARSEDHLGLDIAAKAGSAVHSTASGLVVFSGWTYGYGNLVIISHGDGYFSLYGHNQRNFAEERQWIGRGDVLALVGESGLSSGPHLHFEIWENGNPVDPRAYIIQYQNQDLTVSSDDKG
ncbi:MAG: M23 family metallopeptidase [Candidatus Marinimicrobia bacterium]|nr:M23 family metallopeptidase [Candidatus Neomarinimicrobiota bacterium]MDP6593516.1 M23 family metallopeptidase [Candidatus Neomarinimicrobiota bacterium]MDP6836326.1 M23 family metallopeptidase [Candidatus Neomarinimicrobiota bacterium]